LLASDLCAVHGVTAIAAANTTGMKTLAVGKVNASKQQNGNKKDTALQLKPDDEYP